MRNICLIGLPYSGKSTFGYKLHKYIGKGFIDTDNIMKQKYNQSLSTIINKKGNQEFLKLEHNIIKSLSFNNCILSTGGSVIYNPLSMKYIKNELNCDIYHLFLTKQEFIKRIKCLNERGVIIDEGQSIEDLYNFRIKLYEKYSDYLINANNNIDIAVFNK